MGLRWRSKAAIEDVADDPALFLVHDLARILPLGDLSVVLRHSLVDELVIGAEDDAELAHTATAHGISAPVARLLGWLARTEPDRAEVVIGETIQTAHERLRIPREATEFSLALALRQDSGLDRTALSAFLERALPPRAA